MQQKPDLKTFNKKVVTSKTVIVVSIIVTLLTCISVWLIGLGQHNTLFENSLVSTTILSVAFFCFLTFGLYNGIKVNDNIGKITDKLKYDKTLDFSNNIELPADIPDIGEGFAEVLIGILAWLLFSIILLLFIWFFCNVFWAMILIFAAMLYWIFFRALRLVFKNSNKCKGNFSLSFIYGFSYTALYNFWIYGIILTSHYLVN